MASVTNADSFVVPEWVVRVPPGVRAPWQVFHEDTLYRMEDAKGAPSAQLLAELVTL